jgi:hypothetical protein
LGGTKRSGASPLECSFCQLNNVIRGWAAGPFAWWVVCTVAGALALLLKDQPGEQWQWHAVLIHHEPWRLLTALGVHYSPWHLYINLGALALVAWLGWLAQVGRFTVFLAVISWPLTHLLVGASSLTFYGGLSGWLHAMVVLVGGHLVIATHPKAKLQWIGWGLWIGVTLKVALETPWHTPLVDLPALGIVAAPAAHACGWVAGFLGALVLWIWQTKKTALNI